MHIGIFDSGRGGELVAEKLKASFPAFKYLVVNDLAHAPYGERSYEEIRQLTKIAVQPLLTCDLIIIACNTATVAAIGYLRNSHPNTSFIGFEPMIKPAALETKSEHITLLATKATAHSQRTEELITTYASSIIVDVPTTFGWATLIDKENVDEVELTEVATSVKAGSDVIIIGCTHYIALIPRLAELFPGVKILEPTTAVAQQVTRLLNVRPQQ